MKDQKDFYNYIRQEYKKKKDVTEVPEFMKVYYEIEYASNYEINKFYYALCNYIFLGINQAKVDKTMEYFLDKVEENITYDKWYCGHYHTEKQIDKLEFMYEETKYFNQNKFVYMKRK